MAAAPTPVERPAVFSDPAINAETVRIFRRALARCTCPNDCPCGRALERPEAKADAG